MDIMDAKTLREGLCANFCGYYKPGKKEDLACGGFIAAQKLIDNGLQLSFIVSRDVVSCVERDASPENALSNALCRACPFYDGDCDFILKEGKARPCGGFIFLAHLLAGGAITIDDIKHIA